jgi:CheY-like chemotaxis protein
MLRVLVVDDDPDTRESMGSLLDAWGHRFLTARDGAAAIEAAECFRPDVLLLDLALGTWPDGYEVARRVRRLTGKQPVIICVSGYGRDEDRLRSHESGCNLHLLKPADPDNLAQLLRSIDAGVAPAV